MTRSAISSSVGSMDAARAASRSGFSCVSGTGKCTEANLDDRWAGRVVAQTAASREQAMPPEPGRLPAKRPVSANRLFSTQALGTWSGAASALPGLDPAGVRLQRVQHGQTHREVQHRADRDQGHAQVSRRMKICARTSREPNGRRGEPAAEACVSPPTAAPCPRTRAATVVPQQPLLRRDLDGPVQHPRDRERDGEGGEREQQRVPPRQLRWPSGHDDDTDAITSRCTR